MRIMSTYSVKIKHYNHIFRESVGIYRSVVDFLINVSLAEWDKLKDKINNHNNYVKYLESLTVVTKQRPSVKYDISNKFYKLPVYLRRAAIAEAVGKILSYKSNLKNWELSKYNERGRQPSYPKSGFIYPVLYRGNMFVRTDDYTAQIKVFRNNTWDWVSIQLRKSDVDYIIRHCHQSKECTPTLRRRGKQWFLDFPFEEKVKLHNISVFEQTVASVDLGINSAATVSIMRSDGTVLGRHFLKLPKEYDSLKHSVNRIKKAQQNRNHKTPRLWARAKGINDSISVKTANFIIDTAVLYDADIIVFEHLELKGKKKGFTKQKLHMWRSAYVQKMVTDKAHRLSIRISHVNAWDTSKLAFDGSGYVLRGKDGRFDSYSICRFPNGKIYNCDLSASYNIGSRYFIREILKSLPEKERLAVEAKVPRLAKRSTCTLSTLISLNAELLAIG